MPGCTGSPEEQFYGSVTVGERGQIVIPAEARRQLNINTGDKLLVIGHPASNGLLLCSIEAFREFIAGLMEGVNRAEQKAGEESEDE
ncbi:MAG: AbrB/MazE/SpoVT family DNA-binding domain-containing protein [Armatimonadota bacterium]|jgi:AbrB family looped-hinge helix DNA binding protein